MEQNQNQDHNPNTVTAPNPQYEKYSQMGGWLLFLVILAVIDILFKLWSLFTSYPALISLTPSIFELESPVLNLVTVYDLVGIPALTILSFLTIVMILRRHRSFLTFFSFCVIIGLLSLIMIFVAGSAYPESLTVNTAVLGFIGFVISFLVLLYFATSVRVRTYMGNDEYITKSLFTRGVKPPQPIEPFSTLYLEGSFASPVPSGGTASAPTPAQVNKPEQTDATPEPEASPPPGWYKDPASPENICWWDGQQWLLESRRLLKSD